MILFGPYHIGLRVAELVEVVNESVVILGYGGRIEMEGKFDQATER